jgi:hypothetical protein
VPALPRTVGWHAALKHDRPALPFVPPEYVGRRLLMLVSMWLDDAEDPEGTEMISRLTEIGEPCIKASTVLPFAAGVQRLIDTALISEDEHAKQVGTFGSSVGVHQDSLASQQRRLGQIGGPIRPD